MPKVRERLSFANVMSVVAVFIALGGAAFAAGLARNSVKSKQIKDGQVKSVDVADDALTGTDIQEASLTLPAGTTGPQGPPGPPGEADTPAQVLSKLLNVDGSGSGLDADTLDGTSASDYFTKGEADGRFTRGGGLRTGVSIGTAAGANTQYALYAGLIELQIACSAGGVPGVALKNISGSDMRVYTDDGQPTIAVDSPLVANASTAQTSNAPTDGSGDHVTYFVRSSAANVLVTVDVWLENPAGTSCAYFATGDGLGNGLSE